MLRIARSGMVARGFATLLIVSTLALNPVACIIHCYFVEQTPPTIEIAGQKITICHTPTSGSSNAPAPLPPDLLQALYTFALVLGTPAVSLLPVLLALWIARFLLVPQYKIPPPLPPPRQQLAG